MRVDVLLSMADLYSSSAAFNARLEAATAPTTGIDKSNLSCALPALRPYNLVPYTPSPTGSFPVSKTSVASPATPRATPPAATPVTTPAAATAQKAHWAWLMRCFFSSPSARVGPFPETGRP